MWVIIDEPQSLMLSCSYHSYWSITLRLMSWETSACFSQIISESINIRRGLFLELEQKNRCVCVFFCLTCAAVKHHKNSFLSKCTFTPPISNIETEGTYKFLPTRRPLVASPGSQSLQNPPCHARLNIGVMEIACGMRERDGPSAAVWSSLLVRAGRRLGKGPWVAEEEGCWLVETAGGLPFKGTVIQRWSAVDAWVAEDRNADGTLPLVESTSHTPKCVHCAWGFMFFSRLTCRPALCAAISFERSCSTWRHFDEDGCAACEAH